MQRATLQAGETLDLQLAFRPASASYIEVRAIVDLNRNGRADPGEPGANAVPIDTQPDEVDPFCSPTVDGVTTIGPVINASYSVSVADVCPFGPLEPPAVAVGSATAGSVGRGG